MNKSINKKQKVILTVDTSTPNLSIALYKNNKIYGITLSKEIPYYAENLVPQLDKLLNSTKTLLKDISIIGCNIGPGSFTGLRIGLTFARTLAEELNKKIFVSNSFYIALTHFLHNKNILLLNNKITVIVLLSAIKSEVYYKKFVINKNCIIQTSKNLCVKKTELGILIKNKPNIYVISNSEYNEIENLINLKRQNITNIFYTAEDLVRIYLETNLYTIVSTKNLFPLYIRHTYY